MTQQKSVLIDVSESTSSASKKTLYGIAIAIAALVCSVLYFATRSTEAKQTAANDESTSQEQPTDQAKATVAPIPTASNPLETAPQAMQDTSSEPVALSADIVSTDAKEAEPVQKAVVPTAKETLQDIQAVRSQAAALFNNTDLSKVSAVEFQLEAARQNNRPTAEVELLEQAYATDLLEASYASARQTLQALATGAQAADVPTYATIDWNTYQLLTTAINASSDQTVEQLNVFAEAYAALQQANRSALANLSALAQQFAAQDKLEQACDCYRKTLLLDPNNDSARAFLHQHAHPAGSPAQETPAGWSFAWVPAGDYLLGSPETEFQREEDETQRQITLSQAFIISSTEVTQGQWKAVMGAMPAEFPSAPDQFVSHQPVHSVTWAEAFAFCEALTQQTGAESAYRLPTEAEWEVACRAGSTQPFNTDNDLLTAAQANIFDPNADDSIDGPTDVAQYQPNAWGLYDMHGNVWEWTSDWLQPYSNLETLNPSAATLKPDDENIATKVLRGGSFYDEASFARSANRWSYSPSIATEYIGFRVVRTASF